jgi:hypothetical protein
LFFMTSIAAMLSIRITGVQLRAARSLTGLSQAELATRALAFAAATAAL